MILESWYTYIYIYIEREIITILLDDISCWWIASRGIVNHELWNFPGYCDPCCDHLQRGEGQGQSRIVIGNRCSKSLSSAPGCCKNHCCNPQSRTLKKYIIYVYVGLTINWTRYDKGNRLIGAATQTVSLLFPIGPIGFIGPSWQIGCKVAGLHKAHRFGLSSLGLHQGVNHCGNGLSLRACLSASLTIVIMEVFLVRM